MSVYRFWNLQAFEKLFALVKDQDCEIFTYTAATQIRSLMLAAGFFTAYGAGTGRKTETTAAFTQSALMRRKKSDRIPRLLDKDWLGRFTRSSAPFPEGTDESEAELIRAKIMMHPQFD